MTRTMHSERVREGIAARRAWLAAETQRPVPARGHMPFPGSKTIAEIEGTASRCAKCKAVRIAPCSYTKCPIGKDVA